MTILRKETDGSRKYLRVWFLRIPYETTAAEGGRRLKIGPFCIPYQFFQKNDWTYLKLWRLCLPWGRVRPGRRERHFQEREKLTTEYCIRLLQEELAGELGYRPNIIDPQSFNEKILWMKFFYHDPLITVCCDKYSVKQYVAQTVGGKYVLPTLAVWEDPAKIDFSHMPEQFVLKVNWSSGYNIIVRDKRELDCAAAAAQLAEWMRPERNSYYDTFNWGYKNMRPVCYAEPYIEQCDGQVYDYKFFICNGRFEFMFVATDRSDKETLTHDFFDADFHLLPFTYGHRKHTAPPPSRPEHYDEMVELSLKLAKPFPFVRVDFYEAGGRVYVGEMTFYPGGGTLGFDPVKWDYELGRKIQLPKKREVN